MNETPPKETDLSAKIDLKREIAQGDCTNKSYGYRGLRIPGVFPALFCCLNVGDSSWTRKGL